MHGIEASLLSQSCFLKLRASSVRACWSGKTTFAPAGTVSGVDLGFSIVLFCFRVLRRYLVFRPRGACWNWACVGSGARGPCGWEGASAGA